MEVQKAHAAGVNEERFANLADGAKFWGGIIASGFSAIVTIFESLSAIFGRYEKKAQPDSAPTPALSSQIEKPSASLKLKR
ncbi:MAG: hypothetical protein LBS61_02640 [Endomicrobium sp.]|jgi:hypothetical protein|nr:hypothetical protein [Endomicrobium sp.]